MKLYSPMYMMILALICLMILTACGGGGGSTTTQTPSLQNLDLTVGLQGSPIVGAVDVEIILPSSYALAVGSNGQPTAAALTQLLNGSNLSYALNYIPATTTTSGLIKVGIISANGITLPANLFKINSSYAVGATLPAKEDFVVTVTGYDLTTSAELPGITNTATLTVTPAP